MRSECDRPFGRAAENYYWALGSNPKRSGNAHSDEGEKVVPFNVLRSEDAQRRIKAVVSRLEQEGQFPSTATARAKLIAAEGISTRTLYNHLELWHPIHYQSGSCKTVQPETITAIFESDSEDPSKSLEPSEEKRFYTLGGDMKGGRIIHLFYSISLHLTLNSSARRFDYIPRNL